MTLTPRPLPPSSRLLLDLCRVGMANLEGSSAEAFDHQIQRLADHYGDTEPGPQLRHLFILRERAAGKAKTRLVPSSPPQAREAQAEAGRVREAGAKGLPVWNDMNCAPLDGTLVRLLVKFDSHPIEDTDAPTATIGSHNDGEWSFVGWDWHRDEWARGGGDLLGWLPMHESTPAPQAREPAEPVATKPLQGTRPNSEIVLYNGSTNEPYIDIDGSDLWCNAEDFTQEARKKIRWMVDAANAMRHFAAPSQAEPAQPTEALVAAANRLLQEVRVQRGYAHSEQDQFLQDIEACAIAALKAEPAQPQGAGDEH